eukprot:5097270-Pleurochrysis_carterae.AAC.1
MAVPSANWTIREPSGRVRISVPSARVVTTCCVTGSVLRARANAQGRKRSERWKGRGEGALERRRGATASGKGRGEAESSRGW